MGASDAPSTAWGGMVAVREIQFRVGEEFPPTWILRHINAKEAFALYHLLKEYCVAYPDTLWGTQVRVDVDNQSVVHAFNKGRSRNAHVHEVLVKLFTLQVQEGFWLRLRWIPTEENVEADRMTRLGIEESVRLRPESFEKIWNRFGPFQYDWMATDVSVQRVPQGWPNAGKPLRFFSRFACPGATGVDVLAQNLAQAQPAFCFQPPGMAGELIQRWFECKTQAVVLLPDIRPAWFSLMKLGLVDKMRMTEPGDRSVFIRDHHLKGEQPFVYPAWGMAACRLDFSMM